MTAFLSRSWAVRRRRTTRSGAIIARGMIGSARPCSPRRCGPRRKHSTRRACSIPAFSLIHDVQPNSRSLPSLDQCQSWVIRYRSLRDENRSMSAMPRKRRRAVKMSPVAMGQLRTSRPFTPTQSLSVSQWTARFRPPKSRTAVATSPAATSPMALKRKQAPEREGSCQTCAAGPERADMAGVGFQRGMGAAFCTAPTCEEPGPLPLGDRRGPGPRTVSGREPRALRH
jgi:hypothetical protein